MSSYKDLLAQREQLDKQIKEAVLREKADGIAKAKLIIEQYDLTFDWYRRAKFSMPVSAYTPSAFPWKAFWMPPSAEVPIEEPLEDQEEQEGAGNPKKNYTPKQRAIIANIMKKRYSNA
jgi:hypothetical protein